MPDKRQRGGQPKNRNALKHGFYSRTFQDLEHLDLDAALAEGLDNEIAMLRVITRRVLDLGAGVDDLDTATKLLGVLGAASTRLAGLLRTQKLLGTDQTNTALALQDALSQVVLELGIGAP
jgi:hypothetical protein